MNFKVYIPCREEEIVELAESISSIHRMRGNLSPLNRMTEHQWETNQPKLLTIIWLTSEFEDKKDKCIMAEALRGKLVHEIKKSICESCKILSQMHANNLMVLSEWGFTLRESKQSHLPGKII